MKKNLMALALVASLSTSISAWDERYGFELGDASSVNLTHAGIGAAAFVPVSIYSGNVDSIHNNWFQDANANPRVLTSQNVDDLMSQLRRGMFNNGRIIGEFGGANLVIELDKNALRRVQALDELRKLTDEDFQLIQKQSAAIAAADSSDALKAELTTRQGAGPSSLEDGLNSINNLKPEMTTTRFNASAYSDGLAGIEAELRYLVDNKIRVGGIYSRSFMSRAIPAGATVFLFADGYYVASRGLSGLFTIGDGSDCGSYCEGDFIDIKTLFGSHHFSLDEEEYERLEEEGKTTNYGRW